MTTLRGLALAIAMLLGGLGTAALVAIQRIEAGMRRP